MGNSDLRAGHKTSMIMNNEQQQQAKALYFQTDMSKTQIAELLNISRRSLHYWIRLNNWDRLKQCNSQMPSLIAEKCYHIMSHFSDNLLSELRVMKPVTHKEADTLHKLALTIGKLKNRSTLNESMEMFGFFMESVSRRSPRLAKEIAPFIDEYVSSRADSNIQALMPEHFSDRGFIPVTKEDILEEQLDVRDVDHWMNLPKCNLDFEPETFSDEPAPSAPEAEAPGAITQPGKQNAGSPLPSAPASPSAPSPSKRPGPLPTGKLLIEQLEQQLKDHDDFIKASHTPPLNTIEQFRAWQQQQQTTPPKNNKAKQAA